MGTMGSLNKINDLPENFLIKESSLQALIQQWHQTFIRSHLIMPRLF